VQIELVSPETITYSGEADFVLARTRGGGDIAFQPGHVPFVGSLEVCKVEILTGDGGREVFAVHGGFIQVANDKVTILSDVSEHVDEIDVNRAQTARDRAQAALAEDEADAEAAAALARSLVRLRTAGGDDAPV
jgi:F-type H+-transporting ATPase subunit epsilon